MHGSRTLIWTGGLYVSGRGEDSVFRWSDGTEWDYSPWGIGEPNGKDEPSCIELRLHHTNKFNDEKCEEKGYGLCYINQSTGGILYIVKING